VVDIDEFPISIDFSVWNELGARATTRGWAHRRDVGADTIFLGVDRLDYTKGILQRLTAFGELLDEGRLELETCTFVQIGVPTRCDVPAYRRERDCIEMLTGQINARHRRENGSEPIIFMQAAFEADELAAWYTAADVLVVTSLADGMNLVAKEFVAARGTRGASVILSEFAGAAAGLHGALIVNPYDIEAIKQAMLHALRMPEHARQERLRAMRATVQHHDVHHWARQFLCRLQGGQVGTFPTQPVNPAQHGPDVGVR
jgi:trehalose-6-phosphate synthase